jgi:hypothetical protein
MKLLIVGMPDSIHFARWIEQVKDNGWDLRVFASTLSNNYQESLRDIVVYSNAIFRPRTQKRGSSGIMISSDRLYKYLTGSSIFARIVSMAIRLFCGRTSDKQAEQLERRIRSFKPDIIHSMETQGAGYLVLEARKAFGDDFPAWLHTNWGSDIYLFGRFEEHAIRIRNLLALCDYYSCECERDAALARVFGFKGRIMPIIPNAGGFDLSVLSTLRTGTVPPSERKVIMLKGYQGWAGRSFCGLRALARAKDLLSGYRVVIYSNDSTDMNIASRLLSQDAGIEVTMLDRGTRHVDILRQHGQARISIGLSISDAISTSLLEAMAMGSFPIQSWTSAADEWVKDGSNGLLVPPEDPEMIEAAIRKALSDDELVDSAADINRELVEMRLDSAKIASVAQGFYRSILQEPPA